MVPEQKVRYIPYTTCRMVPEEQTSGEVPALPDGAGGTTCQVPYTTCHMVAEEHCTMVPETTCAVEPYCYTRKVTRYVPVCDPVCERPAGGQPRV